MQVSLASKFFKGCNDTPNKLGTCSGNRGVGVDVFSQYAGLESVLKRSRGQVGLLEVDHLDIKGLQVNNGKDSRLRN